MTRVQLLCVGGRDSSHGAGLDADRDAARVLELDLREVMTADTDQDSASVRWVAEVAPERWLAAARELAPSCAGLKLGLLPGAPHVRAAAALAREVAGPVVLDPVLASSSGHVFLDTLAVEVLLAELLPACTVLTPNLPEAAALTGMEPDDLALPEGRIAAACALAALGASAVLVKGGHGAEDPVRDLVLSPPDGPLWLEHPRVPGTLRGTGCRFATAVAGLLARGERLVDAAARAGELVARRMAEG